MEWLNNSLSGIFLFLGIGLLAIEMLVFGFSSFILFFLGLAFVITGVLLLLGLLLSTLTTALVAVVILTIVIALLLWKPLKEMQIHVDDKPINADFIGHSFVLSKDIEPGQTITYDYSGTQWTIKSSETLKAGIEVKVLAVDVGEFTVAQK